MDWIIVNTDWAVARNILPLPTMKKSRDGMKLAMHKEFVESLGIDTSEVPAYVRNSEEFKELMAGEEWAGDPEEVTNPDYVAVAAAHNLLTVTKGGIQALSLTDDEALSVADMFPTWEELVAKGAELAKGTKLQYGGKLYKVLQTHTPQEGWKPDATGSLYGLISAGTGEHAGTKEDPIPYVPKMVLYAGLYYSEDGVTYLCRTNSIVGYDVTLASGSLDALVERVEKE